jgi:diguanylate cyclase (GGDEF)-like protein
MQIKAYKREFDILNASFVCMAALLFVLAIVFYAAGIRHGHLPQTVPFAGFEQTKDSKSEQTFAAIKTQPRKLTSLATDRSEQSFYIAFELDDVDHNTTIILPSRHLRSAECWSNTSKQVNGESEILVKQFKAGRYFQVEYSKDGTGAFVCKIQSSGPAKIQVVKSTTGEIEQEIKRHSKETAALEGSILALATFCALVALVSREKAYFVFGAWMFFNLRLVEMTTGADIQILGNAIPPDYFDLIRRLAMTGYFITTAKLFLLIVAEQIPEKLRDWFVSPLYLMSIVLTVALILPYGLYLPFLWICSVVGIAIVCAGVAVAIAHNSTRTLLWYSLSWGFAFAGILFEIFSAVLPNFVAQIPLDNVSGSIGASMFSALCLAERINVERKARLEAQASSINALEKYQTIYKSVPVALVSYSLDSKVIQSNPEFEALIWNSRDRKTLQDLIFLEPSCAIQELKKGVNWIKEEVELSFGWISVEAALNGQQIEAYIVDVSERILNARKLQEAANRDPLTNLYNRFKMIDLLEQRLAANIESTVTTDCIAMIDIDAFDRVITNFGHGVGDDVLLAYRDRIQELLPTTATLGRLSADTLLILMPNTPLNEARYVVQAILNSIHKAPFETRVLTVAIKASAGVSVIESKTSKEVLAACDSALQDAKAKGGGQLIAYGERDKAWLAHKAEQELMAEFSQEIPFDRFQIVMQPIVTLLNAKEDIRYEALIRMKSNDGNMLTPALFLPALEKIGLMSQLDRWVVRQVLEFLERESDHFARLTYASVNLSGASINDERFTDELLRLAAKHPHLVRKVCFEITENIALADMEATKRFIHRLRIIGARIALDDFGAGYSSFSYLAQLKVDSIKIDGSLVKGIDEDPAKQAIVKTIVDLGKALGSEVVAEWVETPKTLAILGRLGVDAGQGWALGKPVSMADIAAADHGASFITDKNIAAILGINQSELTNA